MPEMGTDTFARILMRGDIVMGANGITFTDILVKRHLAARLGIRNLADLANVSLDVLNIYMTGGLSLDTTGAAISSPNSDDKHIVFNARDNTVGLAEVARLQGAAEPHLLLTAAKFVTTPHTVNAGHRGFLYLTEGGAGVPDKLYIVMKNTADGYEATQVASAS